MKPHEKTKDRIKRIEELLADKTSMVIVMQDHPDPDAIAAAVALRKLVNSVSSVQCSIAHGGAVGRAENRALVRYLNLNLRSCDEIDFGKFDCTAIVDTQPEAGNNSFPEDCVPDIVIDHHPLHKKTRKAPLMDIRKQYGATSTILLEYLTEAGITPDAPLATALLYGIRSDTQDLGKEAKRADTEAIGQLYPLANKKMLSEIQRGRVQRDYYRYLAEGLQNAKVYDNCVITSLGEVTIPDMVGEVADLLLRDDTTNWALCYAVFDGQMLLSARTSQTENSAEGGMKKVVSRVGTGGGHESIAGGQISLKKGTKSEVAEIEKRVRQRFIKAVGANSQYGVKLLRAKAEMETAKNGNGGTA